MVVRREERIARLALGSDNRAGRLKARDDAPQLIETIPLDVIDPDPDQPRRHFDQAQLQGLADSLVSVGQLQPIIVVRAGERYLLHVGERRWRASRLAGLATIRALVRATPLEARATRIAQIVENEQRADLSTSDLIDAVRELQGGGLKNVEIASALSKAPARISELVALAAAPPALRRIVDQLGQDLSYQLLRHWRADPEATLEFLDHMPIDLISRVTITTIGQGGSLPSKDLQGATDQSGASSRPRAASGAKEPVKKGTSPRERPSPSSVSDVEASETQEHRSRPLDTIAMTGAMLVEHCDLGSGHVVFGIEAPPDHLAVSFAGVAPRILHKDALHIVRTLPPGVACG